MGKFYDVITASHRDFIAKQQMFFAATAPSSGRINLSPKGLGTFRVLDEHTVGYLDLTGSGAEAAAHLAEDGRMTLMFCSFEKAPLILRLYGKGRVITPRDTVQWAGLRPQFGAPVAGERQLVIVEVSSIQTSCGFGVPLYEYVGQRETLIEWAEKKGPEAVATYRVEHNSVSIDGLPTFLNTP